MKLFIILLVCGLFIFAGTIVHAEIVNPGFESASDPCDGESFVRPLGWYSDGYAAIRTNFTAPISGTVGETQNATEFADWYVPDNTIIPYRDNSFLLLSTGDLLREVESSSVKQNIVLEPGNVIEFAYFFGTMDYAQWYDEARVWLEPVDSELGSNFLYCFHMSVQTVGDHRSTDGWQIFRYDYPLDFPAEFRLVFHVTDILDYSLRTYFAVDDVKILLRPEKGDFNDDLVVDFKDHAILLKHWNKTYPEPEMFEGTDLDGNGIVDISDLIIFKNYWLNGL